MTLLSPALRLGITLAAACLLPFAARAEGDASAPAAQAAPAPQPLTEIDLVFVPYDFKPPGLAAEPDAKLIDWKLPDLARLVQERAPKLLAANGLTGQVIVLPKLEPNEKPRLDTLAPERPALVVLPAKFTKETRGLFTVFGTIEFDTAVINPSPQTLRLAAHLPVRGELGADRSLGALVTNRVDARWVDKLLMSLLASYARLGVIQLAGHQVVEPPR